MKNKVIDLSIWSCIVVGFVLFAWSNFHAEYKSNEKVIVIEEYAAPKINMSFIGEN